MIVLLLSLQFKVHQVRLFSSSAEWSEAKKVTITTCKKVYSDPLQARYIFKKCPSSGIQIDVDYLDTNCSDVDQKRPTILAVHGAPGNYNDYSAVISRFKEKGFRVVAPNFPGNLLSN